MESWKAAKPAYLMSELTGLFKPMFQYPGVDQNDLPKTLSRWGWLIVPVCCIVILT